MDPIVRQGIVLGGFLGWILTGASFAQSRVYDELHRMLPSMPDDTTALAAGDLDGDLDVDLLIGNRGEPEVIEDNDGLGRFVLSPAVLPAPTDLTESVALVDVDGDQDLDVYLGNQSQDRLARNDGSLGFTDVSHLLPPDSFDTRAVATGDVDGDLDAYLGVNGQDHLWRNLGGGLFVDGTAQIPSDGDAESSIAQGDVDGDGDLDLYFGVSFTNPQAGQNRLYRNDGTGIFADATSSLPSGTDDTRSAALVDVDGDGDLDAVSVNSPTMLVMYPGGTFQPDWLVNRIDRNDGSGNFIHDPAALPAASTAVSSIAAADVDGDSDADLVVGNGMGGQNLLLLNDGAGVFTDATEAVALPGGAVDFDLGDVDGDQDLDAWLTRGGAFSSGPLSRLFENDGAGGLLDRTASSIPILPARAWASALGDVDGDGDLDLAVANDSQDSLLRNDGTGNFTDDTASLPPDADPTRDVALGDVDGDGDLDLVAANRGTQLRLSRNDGTGRFADATAQLPPSTGLAQAAAFGDVDGDGDLDLAIAQTSQPNRLFRNDGTGTFTDATAQLPVQSDDTFDLAFGDVDGDQDLDLLAGNVALTGGPSRLYRNDGAGTFTLDTLSLPVPPSSTFTVLFGDADGDGDLDAFLGNGSGSSFSFPGAAFPYQNALYRNDGTGVFTDSSEILPAVEDDTTAMALGDTDGDLDLDLVVANGLDASRFEWNLASHLAWRDLPRAGKPVVMDLHGKPGQVWFLLFSFATGTIPTPWGTLGLDPQTSFLAGSGLLDASGRATFALPLPANTSLAGVSAYWQAILLPSPRLTDLDRTTFLAL